MTKPFLHIISLTALLAVTLPAALAEESETVKPVPSCPDGKILNPELGECLLDIPTCTPQEYLDQLTLSCVRRDIPITKEQCAQKGLKLANDERSCIALDFIDYCRSADESYEFLRTVSLIMNSLDASRCEEAYAILKSERSLRLNDPRFRLGSLAPLQYLGDTLLHLELRNQDLVDIEALATLTRLRTLNLAGNDISDISPLQNLKELEYLDLRGNPIDEPGMLAQLPALKLLMTDPSQTKLRKELQGRGLLIKTKPMLVREVPSSEEASL